MILYENNQEIAKLSEEAADSEKVDYPLPSGALSQEATSKVELRIPADPAFAARIERIRSLAKNWVDNYIKAQSNAHV